MTARDEQTREGMITEERSVYRSKLLRLSKINQILYYSRWSKTYFWFELSITVHYTIVMFCPFIRKIHDNEIKLHWTSGDRERAIISFFQCLIRNNSNLVNIFCLGLQYLRFTLEMYIIPFERVYCSCARMPPCDRLLVVL